METNQLVRQKIQNGEFLQRIVGVTNMVDQV